MTFRPASGPVASGPVVSSVLASVTEDPFVLDDAMPATACQAGNSVRGNGYQLAGKLFRATDQRKMRGPHWMYRRRP
jgi:hypothetical protein